MTQKQIEKMIADAVSAIVNPASMPVDEKEKKEKSENMEIIKGNDTLTIKIKLGENGYPSTTGKSLIIASTHGNAIVGKYRGKDLKLSVNLFYKA